MVSGDKNQLSMNSELASPQVLHCVERMHTNAIETWLARMSQYAKCLGMPVGWFYHVQLAERGDIETRSEEISKRVIRSSYSLSQPLLFFHEFYLLCCKQKFDVIHVHADIMSAPYIVAARFAGCKRLIIHVHNADESLPVRGKWKEKLFRPIFRQICLSLGYRIIGISNHTLDTFLANRPRRVGKDRVHYYGIDPVPFLAVRSDRAKFHQELGLAQDVLILLFAGRMVPEKNPLFAVEVFAEMRKRNSRVVAVFVGSGSMEQAVAARANELGIGDSCRFLGWRSDVPEVMTCCDWFILPRPEQPMEGLGIAVVEAQLAGLRLLLSLGIADDPLLPGSVWARLGLCEGAAKWAEEALKLLEKVPPTPQMAAKQLAQSSFDMDFALTDLLSLYNEA